MSSPYPKWFNVLANERSNNINNCFVRHSVILASTLLGLSRLSSISKIALCNLGFNYQQRILTLKYFQIHVSLSYDIISLYRFDDEHTSITTSMMQPPLSLVMAN